MLRLLAVLWLVPGSVGGAARLYTEEDPLRILSSGSLETTVGNSSSAWLVQFFSSWCGHCIQYSSTWKALAQDVQGTLLLGFPPQIAFMNGLCTRLPVTCEPAGVLKV